MKKFFILILLALFMLSWSAFASGNDFLDTCADFSLIFQKSGNLVAEPGGGNMQGDETVIQKAVDENDLWLSYQIDYCETVVVTTYFWNNEEIRDFSFSAKDILKENVSLQVSREVISQAGYWDKVIYTVTASEKEIHYFQIHFPNTKGIATSWAQALGEVRAQRKDAVLYYAAISGEDAVALPSYGETVVSYDGIYFDQAGNSVLTLPLRASILPEGVTFSENKLTITTSVRENEFVLLEALDDEANVVATLRVVFCCLEIGDVNADGVVDSSDFSLACEAYLMESQDINWSQYQRADINQNGCIDIYDIAFLAKKTAILPE